MGEDPPPSYCLCAGGLRPLPGGDGGRLKWIGGANDSRNEEAFRSKVAAADYSERKRLTFSSLRPVYSQNSSTLMKACLGLLYLRRICCMSL